MASSEKRLSRTSGGKRITLIGTGTKVCDNLESSGEKSPNPVFGEERTTKDDASIPPTTSKTSTIKRSASMTSALLGNKQPSRMQLGGATLPIIEDKAEEKDAIDPSMHVLCPSTSSESGDDDETLNSNGASVIHGSTIHEKSTEDKGSKFDGTFVVGYTGSKAGEKHAQLEERTTQTWELRNFTGNYQQYLDNESKYSDDNEAVAVRTSLIQVGDEIECKSIFLANLYFTESDGSDINQNQEGRVNLNLEKGARRSSVSYEASPLETTRILVMVTLKMVDNFALHQGTYLHYRVDLNSNGENLASFVHFLTPIKVGGLASVAVELDMKRFFSKMHPEDSLEVKLNCSVYRPMMEWGLSSKDAEELYGFMLDGKIEKSNRRKVSELQDKCKSLNLVGIVECLESLVPHKFFEDE